MDAEEQLVGMHGVEPKTKITGLEQLKDLLLKKGGKNAKATSYP